MLGVYESTIFIENRIKENKIKFIRHLYVAIYNSKQVFVKKGT
jgi:hypothetical protein